MICTFRIYIFNNCTINNYYSNPIHTVPTINFNLRLFLILANCSSTNGSINNGNSVAGTWLWYLNFDLFVFYFLDINFPAAINSANSCH